MARQSRNPPMVQANETTPYPHSWIANKLNIPLELLEETLELCKAQERISENSSGIKVIKFEEYQEPTERQTQSRDDIIQKFEVFWETYPKKKSKGQAEKAFSKLNPSEQLLTVMLAAISRARATKDWQKEDGQYIPYPATWLNAKGWEDEIKEGGQNGAHQKHPRAIKRPEEYTTPEEYGKRREACS